MLRVWLCHFILPSPLPKYLIGGPKVALYGYNEDCRYATCHPNFVLQGGYQRLTLKSVGSWMGEGNEEEWKSQ